MASALALLVPCLLEDPGPEALPPPSYTAGSIVCYLISIEKQSAVKIAVNRLIMKL
jgi:hypothetical protein